MKKYLQLVILMLVMININAQSTQEFYPDNYQELFDFESISADDLWILDSTYHYAGTNQDYTIFNNHDNVGNLITSVSRYRNETTGEYDSVKDSTAYTYTGNIKTSRIIFAWNRNLSIYSDTLRYSEYNAAGDPTRVLYRGYDEDTDTFIFGSDGFSLYNADGNIEFREFVTWDASVQDWYKSGKDEFFYDSNNLLISRTSEHWDSDLEEYVDNNIYTYVNDANGVLLSWKRESWLSGIDQWFEVENRSYNYNTNGDVKQEFHMKFDYQNLELISDRIIFYQYDNNKLSRKDIEKYDVTTGNYFDSNQFFYFYDANDFLVAYISDRYDIATGQWINHFRYDYFYSIFDEQTCYIENTIDQGICFGEVYMFGGKELNVSGTYIDTIQNDQCDTIVNLSLVVLPEIELTNTDITIDNGSSNGSISIEVKNANNQYIYDWSNGGSTNTVANLSAGEYCCTVTNEVGCTNEFCFIIELSCITESNVEGDVCFGGIYIFGGKELNEAGTYIDTIQNDQCDTILTLNLNVLAAIEMTNSEITDDNGTGDGSVSIDINSGNGTFIYNWSTGGTGNAVDGLEMGEYCCTVTNEADCFEVFCFIVGLETSLNDLAEDELVVFPNPLREGLSVQINYEGGVREMNTQIYNTLGKMIYSGKTTNKIDYNFKKGLYLIVLEVDNKKIIKKIIVE